jgi:hypothetical protein
MFDRLQSDNHTLRAYRLLVEAVVMISVNSLLYAWQQFRWRRRV